ncbi:MAG: iron-containing alcohol dehydrogenase [Termitinemataceae bacterium]
MVPDLTALLQCARDTRHCRCCPGALDEVPTVLSRLYKKDTEFFLIADHRTWKSAGKRLYETLRRKDFIIAGTYIFSEYPLWLDRTDRLGGMLSQLIGDAVPLAIGAGSIHDIVRLAAGMTNRTTLKRPYIAIPTAPSTDTFTSPLPTFVCDVRLQTPELSGPIACIADTSVFDSAPQALVRCGLGEILALCSVELDWTVSEFLAGSDDSIQDITGLTDPIHRSQRSLHCSKDQEPSQQSWGDYAWHLALDCKAGGLWEQSFIVPLMEGLICKGLLNQIVYHDAHTQRLSQGSETGLRRLWRLQEATWQGDSASRGALAAYASLLVLQIRDILCDTLIPALRTGKLRRSNLAELQTETTFTDAKTAMLPRQDLAAFPVGTTHNINLKIEPTNSADLVQKREQILDRWSELRSLLLDRRQNSAELQALLIRAGLPAQAKDLNLTRLQVLQSIRSAWRCAPGYTLLDMTRDLGLTQPLLYALECRW